MSLVDQEDIFFFFFACSSAFAVSLYKGSICSRKKRNPEYIVTQEGNFMLNGKFPVIALHYNVLSLSQISGSSNLRTMTMHMTLPLLRLAEYAGFTVKALINSNTSTLLTSYTRAFHKIRVMITAQQNCENQAQIMSSTITFLLAMYLVLNKWKPLVKKSVLILYYSCLHQF